MNHLYISEEPTGLPGTITAETIPVLAAEDGLPEDIDLFIVDARDLRYTEDACRAVRSKPVPSIYLKPIVAVNADQENLPAIRAMADKVYTAGETSVLFSQQLTEAGSTINKRIEKLSEVKDTTDTAVAQKILRYLYTRQKELLPFRNALNRFGLHYPDIELLLSGREDSLFQVLDFLESQHLLKSEFFEKIHQCNHCSGSLLNFIEICPQCSSGNLETDDLIHHFHCAHVGPSETFRQKTGYICPKCDKPLSGLGVDYDKPSAVYRCLSCRHVCQEPDVSTICFSCGAKSLPEDLILRTIKTYRISALGENSAIHGIDIIFRQFLDHEIKLLPYSSFKVLLEAEIERIRRYKLSKSSLLFFHIGDFEKLYEQIGNRSKEIFSEMGQIMESVLRACDITTILNEATFISLLPETDSNGALTAIERLKQKFNQLFEANLKKNIVIRTNNMELSGDFTVDGLLSEIIERGTSD